MREVLKTFGIVAQLVRALPCHGRGRGFDSRRFRHKPSILFLTNLRVINHPKWVIFDAQKPSATIIIFSQSHRCGSVGSAVHRLAYFQQLCKITITKRKLNIVQFGLSNSNFSTDLR